MTHRELAPTGALRVGDEAALAIEGGARIPPFERISAVATLSDGTLVVADVGASRIHAFSPDGSHLWSAGRPGEGPGEFRRVESLFVTPADSVLAADVQLGRITVLAPDGTVARDVRFAREDGLPVALLAGGDLLFRDEERVGPRGAGLLHTSARWSAGVPGSAELRVLATTPGRDTYFFEGSGGVRLVLQMSFMRHTLAAAAREDGFVLALADVPQVDRYGLDGRLLRRVRLPAAALSDALHDPQAVRDTLFGDVPEAMRTTFDEVAEGLPIPARWPPVVALLTDAADRVWLQPYVPAGASSSTWHVFAADGAYVDAVALPARFTPMAIGHGRVAGVWKDDLDVESIRVYALEEG